MRAILISLSTILIISLSFNIYHASRANKLADELSAITLSRAVELDENIKLIEKNKQAIIELEKNKSKVITKYIPIATSELKTCEDRLHAIESAQNLFFEVQR